MAKKNRNGSRAENMGDGLEVGEGEPAFQIPAGYEEQTDDIVGFWNPLLKLPVHFIPLEAKTFDSEIDETKSSVLVVGKLVDECELSVGQDEVITGKPGDRVGVWYKPGMKALRNLAGVPCFIFLNGTLDTGKPNPMYTFKVFSKSRGQDLCITQDSRDVSAGNNLPFPLVGTLQGTAPRLERAPF